MELIFHLRTHHNVVCMWFAVDEFLIIVFDNMEHAMTFIQHLFDILYTESHIFASCSTYIFANPFIFSFHFTSISDSIL